jgi:phosphohistidine swiveling domain-containing protein
MVRDAANTWALKNGTNAQTARIYGTTTGPKYLSLSHDGTNGVIDTAASSGLVSIAPTNATSVTLGKKITSYNGVTAVGNGVPVIVGAGRITASNAANANINTYATPNANGAVPLMKTQHRCATTGTFTTVLAGF